MSKKGDYPIPFDKQGNQLDYHEPKGWQPSILKDNFTFDDTLTLDKYGRGRSSVTFTMRRKSGKTVSVFVSDFFDMASHPTFTGGKISGTFTFTKRGQNYGCKMVDVERISNG